MARRAAGLEAEEHALARGWPEEQLWPALAGGCRALLQRSQMGLALMSDDGKLNVFVSYSHADKAWLERVQVHLRPLARGGKLDLWDDTRIRTGQRWRQEIEAALARADVAVSRHIWAGLARPGH